MPDHAPTLRVVQLTDTHLPRAAGQRLKGWNTERSLVEALEHVAAHESVPDLLLLTGDLADDGSAQAYARIASHVSALGVPTRWVPGNHDDPATMRARLCGPTMEGPGTLRLGRWNFLLLDSCVPGEDAGRLSRDQLARLDEDLHACSEDYAFVVLHHPPVGCGTPAMDALALGNSTAFLNLLARHPCVRGVLSGHFHCELMREPHGLPVLVTPSTCYQLRLGGPAIEYDSRPPGYRRLELAPDGTFQTQVVRLPTP